MHNVSEDLAARAAVEKQKQFGWRPLAGFAALFLLYQAPQGVAEHVSQNRMVWLALSVAFLPVAYLVARMLGDRGLSAYGFGRGAWRLPAGFPIGFAAAALAGLAAYCAGAYRVAAVAPISSVGGMILLVAFGNFFASINEDLLTRGFVWRYARELGTTKFVLLSATIFVLNHIYVIGRGPKMWFFLFAMGAALAYPLARTGSLWLTVGIHWGWNMVYHVTNIMLATEDTSRAWMNTWISGVAATVLLIAIVAVWPKPKS